MKTRLAATPKGDWEQKFWGRTREVLSSDFYSQHELELVKGGYCSIHYHRNRANRFFVESGVVEIVQFFASTTSRKILGPDNIFDVPSLVPHMFCVHESGTMLEEYYSDRGGIIETSDICRLVQGGKLEYDESWEANFDDLIEKLLTGLLNE